MKQKLNIHWDPEGDHLELKFADAKSSYYEEVEDDIFERRDEETNEVIGYAIFNIQKQKKPKDFEIELALKND